MKKTILAILLIAIMGVLVACGDDEETENTPVPCKTDDVCKGNRICVDGLCANNPESNDVVTDDDDSADDDDDSDDDDTTASTDDGDCKNDFDCKGDRICEDGLCVDPENDVTTDDDDDSADDDDDSDDDDEGEKDISFWPVCEPCATTPGNEIVITYYYKNLGDIEVAKANVEITFDEGTLENIEIDGAECNIVQNVVTCLVTDIPSTEDEDEATLQFKGTIAEGIEDKIEIKSRLYTADYWVPIIWGQPGYWTTTIKIHPNPPDLVVDLTSELDGSDVRPDDIIDFVFRWSNTGKYASGLAISPVIIITFIWQYDIEIMTDSIPPYCDSAESWFFCDVDDLEVGEVGFITFSGKILGQATPGKRKYGWNARIKSTNNTDGYWLDNHDAIELNIVK